MSGSIYMMRPFAPGSGCIKIVNGTREVSVACDDSCRALPNYTRSDIHCYENDENVTQRVFATPGAHDLVTGSLDNLMVALDWLRRKEEASVDEYKFKRVFRVTVDIPVESETALGIDRAEDRLKAGGLDATGVCDMTAGCWSIGKPRVVKLTALPTTPKRPFPKKKCPPPTKAPAKRRKKA